jgi:uncharacterized protein YjbJ (UPF0337 family)
MQPLRILRCLRRASKEIGQLKGKVKKKWGNLTDALLAINGNLDQLEGKLQERYGIARDRAREVGFLSCRACFATICVTSRANRRMLDPSSSPSRNIHASRGRAKELVALPGLEPPLGRRSFLKENVTGVSRRGLRRPPPGPGETEPEITLLLRRFFPNRKHHAKDSALRLVRRCPQPAAVRFDDRAADRLPRTSLSRPARPPVRFSSLY